MVELGQIPSVDQGDCTQAHGKGEAWDAQTLGSQAFAASWLWRPSSGHGEGRGPACSPCPAVWLLGWLLSTWFPAREAWGDRFCNHRHTGVLLVVPRHSAREATEQVLKAGIALGASWPQKAMSSCSQEACALELPAPSTCCLHPQRAACSPKHPYSTALVPLTMLPADPARSRDLFMFSPECPRVPSSDRGSAEPNSTGHCNLPGSVARLCWESHPDYTSITGVLFHNTVFLK